MAFDTDSIKPNFENRWICSLNAHIRLFNSFNPLMTVVTVTDTSCMTSQPRGSSTNARVFAAFVADTALCSAV